MYRTLGLEAPATHHHPTVSLLIGIHCDCVSSCTHEEICGCLSYATLGRPLEEGDRQMAGSVWD